MTSIKVYELQLNRPYCRNPRCEADVTSNSERDYRIETGQDFRCKRIATHMIGGKKYCKMHAGFLLLEMLVRETEGGRLQLNLFEQRQNNADGVASGDF